MALLTRRRLPAAARPVKRTVVPRFPFGGFLSDGVGKRFFDRLSSSNLANEWCSRLSGIAARHRRSDERSIHAAELRGFLQYRHTSRSSM